MARPTRSGSNTPVQIMGVEDGVTIPTSLSGDSNVITINNGFASINNKSEVNLGAGGIFQGSSDDILNYVSIVIHVRSDVTSATDGLEFQFSDDEVTWNTTDNYTYSSVNTLKTYSIQRTQRYFRLKYTNGGSIQSSFDIGAIYSKGSGVASSHRIGDTITNQDDAQLMKSVLSAEKPDGTQANIGATPQGELKTSVVTPVGVLPVSQLTTLHDGKILNRLYPEINEIVGTGTGAFTNNKYNMPVVAGEWIVKQTRRCLPYYSGKPQKIELTFDNFAPEADVIKRVGYFSSNTVSPYDSDYDGIWLESGNDTIKIFAKRSGTTTVEVDITDWNNYAAIGSYQTLSTWDNFTVIEFNFLWLGGAYIELRLVTSDGFVTAHNLIYAGTFQDVFIKSPNQPVRYEIRSTTGSGNLRYICNQVATSGSIGESGLSKGVNTGTSAFTLAAIGTTYPVIAVRKGTSYKDNMVLIKEFNMNIASNDILVWTLEVNPTLSAPLTYAAVANSAIEKANGNGTITVSSPGTIIASDYLVQGEDIPLQILERNFLAWLSGSITGTQDEFVLCATPCTTNVSIRGSMNLVEG